MMKHELCAHYSGFNNFYCIKVNSIFTKSCNWCVISWIYLGSRYVFIEIYVREAEIWKGGRRGREGWDGWYFCQEEMLLTD